MSDVSDLTKWTDYLPTVEMVVNSLPNRSTGYSPFFLMYGLEMATEFLNAIRVRLWFFLYHRVRPSISVFFLGGEYVCPSYGPLKFLKSAKLGRKSVRPLIKELRNPFLPKFFKKSLNYGRCNI